MGKSVHNTNCCVYNCHSRKNSDRRIHFHYFPKKGAGFVRLTNKFGVVEKVDRRKAWENILLMGKRVTSAMRVCSLHFKREDYIGKGTISSRLSCSALPSLKLPKQRSCSIKPDKNKLKYIQAKQERMLRRDILREKVKSPVSISENYVCAEKDADNGEVANIINLEDLDKDERLCVEGLLKLGSTSTMITEAATHSKATQVTSGDLIVNFTSSIKEDSQLNSLTGLSSFKLLNQLSSLIERFYPDKKKTKLSVRDRIVLVMMKLKMALKFKVLAFLFKLSQARVRTIIDMYLYYLSQILCSQIRWPTVLECKKNLPMCFNKFGFVRVVLDCTEISVQKPSCVCCRIRTYSHYKGGHTLKVMVGVSPAGLITFVSRCYGGRSSDKAIFEQGGLIDKLEPGDGIMVDKGFLVDEICNNHQIKLIRPHFLRNKKQFSAQESKNNVEISRARVHVERINQRIKTFDIFKTALPWNLVNRIDNIFLVICGLVNLQAPILADDSF